MTVSICTLVLCTICTALGYFSRTPDMQMGGVLSERKGKICSIIQGLFNWAVCLIMLFYVIKGYFYDTVLQVAFLFGIQLTVNFIYTLVIMYLTHKIKKKMIVNSMKAYIEGRTFSCEADLIKMFCVEYRDVNPKEAQKALRTIRKGNKG